MKRNIRLVIVLLVFVLVCGPASTGAFEIGELFGWGDWTLEEKKEDSDQRARKEKLSSSDTAQKDEEEQDDYYATLDIEKDGRYDTKDEVCAYLVQFHTLPSNYMTKKDARERGWEGGPLHFVISGMCIGGDYFGNYDGLLPEVEDREYHECDIDTLYSSSRGARRIVYSGDDENGEWNIYYTEDHYESFTLLWGEDDYNG